MNDTTPAKDRISEPDRTGAPQPSLAEGRTAARRLSNIVLAMLKGRGSLIGLIIVCVAFSILSDKFLTSYNVLNIARQSSVNILIAIGSTLIILTGGIDLSVGAVVALVGTLVAGALKAGMPLPLALLVGLGVGSAFGLFSGLCVTRGKIPPFIATLGAMVIARSFALLYSGGYPITGLPEAFSFIGSGYVGFLPTPVVIAALFFAIGLFVLNSTVVGKYAIAIGGNEEATYLSGINVNKWKVIVYGIAGFLTGLAGIVLTARMNSGQAAVGAGLELDIIAAVVIGGTSLSGGEGSLLGTLWGVLAITVLNNGLTLLNVNPYVQGAVIGLVILGAVWLDRRQKKQ